MHAIRCSWTRKSTTTSAAHFLSLLDPAQAATIKCRFQSRTQRIEATPSIRVSCLPMPPPLAGQHPTHQATATRETRARDHYGIRLTMVTIRQATIRTHHGNLNNHEATRAATHTKTIITRTPPFLFVNQLRSTLLASKMVSFCICLDKHGICVDV
jgi:hypothetical protein